MTISYETLGYDKYLTHLLQKKVKLTINNRMIRQGHLVLYTFKNYNIELYFSNKKDTSHRKTEIPIPFDMYTDRTRPNVLVFDYTIARLFPNNSMSDDNKLLVITDNKFYNTKMKIEVIDE